MARTGETVSQAALRFEMSWLALDTQIAAGLRQLELEGHGNLLISELTAFCF